MKRNYPLLTVGTRVFYTGDMANQPANLEVVEVVADTGSPHYNMEEIRDDGTRTPWRGVHDMQIGREYFGHCDPRFVTQEAKDAYRKDRAGRSFDGQLLTEKYSATPKRIDRARFDEMLNCLPPLNWVRGDTETFQLQEMAYSNITLTCMWDHMRCEGWECYLPLHTPHGAIRRLMRAAAAQENATA